MIPLRGLRKASWQYRTAAVLFLFCAFGSATYAQAAPIEERVYEGLTLDEWRERIQHLDYKSPERAAAVPGLRAIMLDPAAPWFTRRQAALTLGRIGEPAERVIDDLVRLLDEPVEPVETAPPLWALKALSLFGPSAAKATPRAIRFLSDDSTSILLRLTATETLGRIGASSAAGIQALIDGGAGRLSASDSDLLELRIACIEALQLGRPPSAIPMLLDACEDSAERVRHAAAATLGFLGNNAEPAAEALGALVAYDETPVVRETAARSLALVGPRGVEVLLRLLAAHDDETILYALDGTSRLAVAPHAVVMSLQALFDHPVPVVAARALDASWTLARSAGPLLDRLVQLLAHSDRAVRKSASDTLVRMGSAARPAIPALEEIEQSGSDEASTAARRVLRSLEASSRKSP
jgi:HEAT repeat protein